MQEKNPRSKPRTLCARQLTEIKALLGAVGELRYVLGCISQLQDGRFFLEDLSDAIPLDLSTTNTASGFFTGAPPDSIRDPGGVLV